MMEGTSSAASAQLSEEPGFDIRHHLGVIRSRFWTIAACAVVVFTLAAIRTFRSTPIYEASTRILVERTLPLMSSFEGAQERGDETYFATQVKLISSKAVLEEALKDERVRGLFESGDALDVSRPGLVGAALHQVKGILGGNPVRPAEPWEQLWRSVQVGPVSGTNLVDIKVRSSHPSQAALIANAVGKAYVDYSVAMHKENAVVAFEMLQEQRKEQERELAVAADARLAYRESATILQLGSSGQNNAALDRVAALNAEYTKVQLQRLKLSVATEAIRRAEKGEQDISSLLSLEPIRTDPKLMGPLKALSDESSMLELRRVELSSAADMIARVQADGKGVESLLTVKVVRNDPVVIDLCDALRRVRVDTEKALGIYGEKHPKVLALKEDMERLESGLRDSILAVAASVEAERQILAKQAQTQRQHLAPQLHESVSAAATAIRANYEMLVEHEKELTAALADQERLALEQARKSDVYRRLVDDEERQKRVFDVILDRMKEADLTKDVGVTNVRIIQEASAPQTPVKPDKKRGLLLGAFLGILLGLAAAYGFEHLDDTIKTPEEVEKRLGVPWLGYVPEIAANAAGAGGFAQRASHALKSPESAVTDSFRSIRTNIYFSGERGEVKSLVITSGMPGEGKTVFATNLAATIAQDGKRVLLVDADLRKPQVHEAFGLRREPGLTNLLVEGTPLCELVQIPSNGDGEFGNLHVLTAGAPAPNPSELLGGAALGQFAREARESYDMVVYDLCPAMFVADAASLASSADGVIMVLKAAGTRRGAVTRTKQQLEAVSGKIIGAVLNRVRHKTLGDYGYGYGYGEYGSRYGKKEAKPQDSRA